MARINGEIIIAAPAEQVFDMVADERNEPRYNPRIARAEKTSQGPVGRGTRFTAQPRGTGAAGVMTVEILDYDRPRRLATSIRSSYLDVDGTLTFDQADGGTRMRWSWDMRLRGAMRVLSPVVRAIGPRWEHRNWAGLKQFMESGREAQAGDMQLTSVLPARPGRPPAWDGPFGKQDQSPLAGRVRPCPACGPPRRSRGRGSARARS